MKFLKIIRAIFFRRIVLQNTSLGFAGEDAVYTPRMLTKVSGWLGGICASLLIVACITDPVQDFEVGTIDLVSSEPVELKMISYYQQEISGLEDLDQASGKVLELLRATFPNAKRSASKIHQLRWIENAAKRPDSLRVRAVFDQVPDDDSVGGFYFELLISQSEQGPRIESFQKSWRCWPGRGHQRFKAEPCS